MFEVVIEMIFFYILVLLKFLLVVVVFVFGCWLDGIFGVGGYICGLFEVGVDKVYGVDCDFLVFEMVEDWIGEFVGWIEFIVDVFFNMDVYVEDLDGVVLDLGVSLM